MHILENREYTGCLVNFKTTTQSYKCSKIVYNDEDKQAIFENHHEPIIDTQTWERVQELRKQRKRPNRYDEVGLFSGILFCADCGSVMYQQRYQTDKRKQDCYICGNYKKRKMCIRDSYGAAKAYLTFEHDEFTMKPTLDENGRLIPREDYRISSLNCGGEDFAVACMRANLRYEKNQKREDVKSHHYIISFDPRDAADNGLTVDQAQELGEKFCKEHFPGHQAIVCTLSLIHI